jgi:hypothetical protein
MIPVSERQLKKAKNIVTMFAWLLVTGCSSMRTNYTPPPPPPSGMATLVFYRGDAFAASARSIEFRIDSNVVATLRNNTYTYIHIQPGDHKVEGRIATWLGVPEKMRPLATSVECQRGKRCFIEYSISGQQGYTSHLIQSVHPIAAERDLATIGYVTP